MKYSIYAFLTLLGFLGLSVMNVNEYVFFAGFVILQFVVLATAWNILGGYAGYVNFGVPAFIAVGAYTAVVLFKSISAPLVVQNYWRRHFGRLVGPYGRPAHP
jgi:branched-chain amino acid transport system permease protein